MPAMQIFPFHGILARCSTKCGYSCKLIAYFRPWYPFTNMDATPVTLSICDDSPGTIFCISNASPGPSFASAMPPQGPSFASAMPPSVYMGQQIPHNLPPGQQAIVGFGNEGAAFGSSKSKSAASTVGWNIFSTCYPKYFLRRWREPIWIN